MAVLTHLRSAPTKPFPSTFLRKYKLEAIVKQMEDKISKNKRKAVSENADPVVEPSRKKAKSVPKRSECLRHDSRSLPN